MAGQRLRRDSERGIVAGVCAGIARRFGYDLPLVRTVAVLLAFAGGFGLVAYLVVWRLTPAGGDPDRPASEPPPPPATEAPQPPATRNALERPRPPHPPRRHASAAPFVPPTARPPRGGPPRPPVRGGP